jgi:ABC-type bacteriocin/lantibiotic exporter with double-glycine peptidase domain
MLLAIFLQLAAVALPFMNVIMNTVPLNSTDWLYLIGGTFSIIILIEIEKFLRALYYKRKRVRAGIEMDEKLL